MALDRLENLDLARAKLLARRDQLALGLHLALVKGLGQAETAESFRTILGDGVWQKLPAEAGPLLFLPIWAKGRFFSLLTGYQFSRLALAGPTIIGAGLLGLSAATGLYRNYGPLRRVVDNLGNSYRVALEQTRNDTQHTLEDMGLPSPEKSTLPAVQESKDSPPWMRFIEDRIKSWAMKGTDDGVLESLDTDIERASFRSRGEFGGLPLACLPGSLAISCQRQCLAGFFTEQARVGIGRITPTPVFSFPRFCFGASVSPPGFSLCGRLCGNGSTAYPWSV